MKMFEVLGIESEDKSPVIDWDLQPAETFGIFESWGGKERIKDLDEYHYYFFIDDWTNPASLFLMERGIKYAKILAKIDAPQEMIDRAVASQGKSISLNRSYAIDDDLKKWLKVNIIDKADTSKVIPIIQPLSEEDRETGLPDKKSPHPAVEKITLRKEAGMLTEEHIPEIIKKNNFFDIHHNPAGKFDNYLVDNEDGLTVTDVKTGITWQRDGGDITSIRKARDYAENMNKQNLAGFNDWRLPGMEEALSLMEWRKNEKGLYLHRCFSAKQPFIFLAESRSPGGYWFCNYREGSVYWASGFNPGGFVRLCRTD